MSAIEIRFLTPDDIAAFWTVRLEALESEPFAFGASPESHRMLTVEEFGTRYTVDPQNNFVVGTFDDGKLSGIAGFVRERGLKELHKGRLWSVYLTPRLRGRGLAKAMLSLLLERAAQIEGLEQILLRVAQNQAAANRLYRSLGFVPFGREPRALKVGDVYLDEEYMVLRLPRLC